MKQSDSFKGRMNRFTTTTGSDPNRLLAMQGAGDGDHLHNRLHIRKKSEIVLLLIVNYGIGIHEEPLHVIEGLDYLTGGTSAPVVVEILRKIRSMR